MMDRSSSWSGCRIISGLLLVASAVVLLNSEVATGHVIIGGQDSVAFQYSVGSTEAEHEGASVDISRTNSGGGGGDIDDGRLKRFVSPMVSSVLSGQAKKDQECRTPAGGRGQCRRLSECVVSEYKRNVWKFFESVCVIKGSIGVCCPEGQESQVANSKITNRFPVIGDDEQDVVFWGADDNQLPQNDTIQSNFGIADNQVRPEDRGCGLATKQFPKITGGRPADPGEWPWMAALLTRGPDKAFCGGALVTDRHVVTAAHCTKRYRREELYVRLGEYDFKRYDETNARDFQVAEIREHEDYDKQSYENDIAMLKLSRPTLFTSYIWPICMPPMGEDWKGWSGVIIGWGSQFFGGPHSHTLMEVTLPIWPQEDCENAFVHRIPASALCAGTSEGGKDSCQGDSGSPLMVQLPNNRWVLVGIVSWGVRCGEPNHPGVYSRVGEYVNWIVENSIF